MPATVEANPMLPSLSPVCGKPIVARFDGAQLSSDGRLLALREVEQRLGIARRLAACIRDPRAPERVMHGLDEIIRFRMLMIAAGYEAALIVAGRAVRHVAATGPVKAPPDAYGPAIQPISPVTDYVACQACHGKQDAECAWTAFPAELAAQPL